MYGGFLTILKNCVTTAMWKRVLLTVIKLDHHDYLYKVLSNFNILPSKGVHIEYIKTIGNACYVEKESLFNKWITYCKQTTLLKMHDN